LTFSFKNEIFFKTWVVNLAISVPLSARVSGGSDADLVASEYEQEVLPRILKELGGVVWITDPVQQAQHIQEQAVEPI
jgi:hypothetical protein